MSSPDKSFETSIPKLLIPGFADVEAGARVPRIRHFAFLPHHEVPTTCDYHFTLALSMS